MATELPDLPANGPATLAGVKTELGITAGDGSQDALLTPRVAAVNAMVRTWPCCIPAQEAANWAVAAIANVVLGANMLAARLFQRRNSPLGYEQVGGDLAVYVTRSDPDIAQLLGLGHYTDPATLVG